MVFTIVSLHPPHRAYHDTVGDLVTLGPGNPGPSLGCQLWLGKCLEIWGQCLGRQELGEEKLISWHPCRRKWQ